MLRLHSVTFAATSWTESILQAVNELPQVFLRNAALEILRAVKLETSTRLHEMVNLLRAKTYGSALHSLNKKY